MPSRQQSARAVTPRPVRQQVRRPRRRTSGDKGLSTICNMQARMVQEASGIEGAGVLAARSSRQWAAAMGMPGACG